MNDAEPPVVTAVEGEEPRQRPSRPVLIELAAALLIVAGILGVISLFAPDPRRPEGLEGLALLTIGLNVVQIVVGILVRAGRLWIVDVNYVAVLGFLDLAGAAGSSLALLLGLVELGTLAVLFAYRSWFDGRWAEPGR
jgi:hypothetical protein